MPTINVTCEHVSINAPQFDSPLSVELLAVDVYQVVTQFDHAKVLDCIDIDLIKKYLEDSDDSDL